MITGLCRQQLDFWHNAKIFYNIRLDILTLNTDDLGKNMSTILSKVYAGCDTMFEASLGTVSVIVLLSMSTNYRVRKEECVQGKGRKPGSPHTRQERERERKREHEAL